MSTFAEIWSRIQPGLPSQHINLADNRAQLSLAEAELLIAQGVTFASNDVIAIKDLAASIEGLTEVRITALGSLGVSQVLATDGALSLSVAQADALATRDIAVATQYQTISPASAHDVLVGVPAGSGVGQSIVALLDGSYVVVYRGAAAGGPGSSIYTQHYDASGNPLGGAVQVSGPTLANEGQATAAALADGGYVVVWSHNGGSTTSAVYAQRFDAEGDAVGGPTQLSPDGPRKYMPGVTGLSDGGYLITIFQNAGADASLTFQRYDANGQPVGSRQVLSPAVDLLVLPGDEGAKITNTVEMADGRVMIVWGVGLGEQRSLAAQIIDASGAKVGPAFFLNTQTNILQDPPSIAVLSDGRFAVAWLGADLENTIIVQLFDGQGTKVGSEIAINASIYAQDPPTITALENGRYVVTWSWSGQDDPNAAPGQHGGIYAQILEADGTKIGPVSLVNTTVAGDQFDPQIVALVGGGYVVIWTDYLSTGSASFEINAQVFSANGTKIGDELDINVTQTNAQRLQKITALAGGGFAVTWLDASDGKYYTRSFQHDTEHAALGDTAAAISALTVSGVAHLRDLGIDTITITDHGGVTLTKAVAAGLITGAGVHITGASGITVTGTGAALDDFSAADIAKLKILGVTGLDVSDTSVTLTFAQAMAYLDAGITLASTDAATVEMTFPQLVALDSNLAALAAFGMKVIDLAENQIALGLAGYRALDTLGLRFAASDVLTLTDYKYNIVNLTVAQIAELAGWGITIIDTNAAETEPTVLSVAQIKAFAAGGIRFAAGELVHLSDGITALSSLGTNEIADLAAIGVSKVVAEPALALTVLQATAYAQHGIAVQSTNGMVSLRDSGAHFASLTTSAIAGLSGLGITMLDVTDNRAVLSLAAIKAFAAADAQFASDDRIVMDVTTASLAAISASDLAVVKAFGVDAITTAGASLDLAITTAEKIRAVGLPLDTDFTCRITDSAANLLALSFQSVADYRNLGVDLFRLVDSGSAIAGLSLANIANLASRSVREIDVSTGAVTLTLAQANQFAASEIVFDAADSVAVSASSGTLSDPDTLDLIGLAAIHVHRIDASDNRLALTLGAARSYVDAGIGFTAADLVTVKISYAEAKVLSTATGQALHMAGVDRIEIDMTAAELKTLTYPALQTFVAAGVDGIIGRTSVTFSNLVYDLVTHRANYNPIITSNGGGAIAAISISENTKTVTTVLATDREAAPLSYAIIGGADRTFFTINARTGALAFKAAPDHEAPQDAGKNNVYDLIVQASDGTLVDTQAIAVTVKNVNEAPTAPTLSGSVVAENVALGTLVGTLSAKDPEGKALSYRLLDTADGLFKLSGSKLVTAKAVDYEKVQKDTVTIEVSDGVHKVTKVFTLTVTDVLETRTGTAKADALSGGIGMDRILGLGGHDTLQGYGGNDLLIGGLGFDDLYGGVGSDRFVFRSVKELGTSKAATDTIFDFSRAEKDVIDLSAIDANLKKAGDQAFTFIGTTKFSHSAGELRYEKAKADTYIYGDINGDGKADFVLHLDAALSLKAGDILL